MNVTFHDLCFTPEEHKELLWTLGEHRRILRDQSSNIYSRHLYNVTENLIQKLGGTSDANHTGST